MVIKYLLACMAFMLALSPTFSSEATVSQWDNVTLSGDPTTVSTGELPFAYGDAAADKSIRVVGTLVVDQSGLYDIRAKAGKSVQLWLDGDLILGHPNTWQYRYAKDLQLDAGTYQIKIEGHRPAGGGGTSYVDVEWRPASTGPYVDIAAQNVNGEQNLLSLPATSVTNPAHVIGTNMNGVEITTNLGSIAAMDERTFNAALPTDVLLDVDAGGVDLADGTIQWIAIDAVGDITLAPGDAIKVNVPAGHTLDVTIGGYDPVATVDNGDGTFTITATEAGNYVATLRDANNIEVSVLNADAISFETLPMLVEEDKKDDFVIKVDFDSTSDLEIVNLDPNLATFNNIVYGAYGIEFQLRGVEDAYGNGQAYLRSKSSGAVLGSFGFTTFEVFYSELEVFVAADCTACGPEFPENDIVLPDDNFIVHHWIRPAVPQGTYWFVKDFGGNASQVNGTNANLIPSVDWSEVLDGLDDGGYVPSDVSSISIPYVHNGVANPKSCHKMEVALEGFVDNGSGFVATTILPPANDFRNPDLLDPVDPVIFARKPTWPGYNMDFGNAPAPRPPQVPEPPIGGLWGYIKCSWKCSGLNNLIWKAHCRKKHL